MKKSELIRLLEIFDDDAEIVVKSGMTEDGHVRRIEKVRLYNARKHHNTYLYLSSYLSTGGFAGRKAFTEPYQSKIEGEPDIPVIHIS